MNIIKPQVEILSPLDGSTILKNIEKIGRTCYKSEDRITDNSAQQFVKALVARGHEAVIEHENITIKFICDRGVSHEIVRHRMASYAQESTRYCNYSKEQFGSEISVIAPNYLAEGTDAYSTWKRAMEFAENAYFRMLDIGMTPQEARCVLPNSLKTEIVMTANLREWRHFLQLRTSKAAHPQIRELAQDLLHQLRAEIPVVFDDIVVGA